MFVGTPQQDLIVVYDTGSDWLTIESNLCDTCLNHTYDHSASSTYSQYRTELSEHLYGSAALYGYDIKDKVWLDEEGTTFVEDFEFFEVHEQTGLVS